MKGTLGPEMYWYSQRGREASLPDTRVKGAFKGAHEPSASSHDSDHPPKVEGNHFSVRRGAGRGEWRGKHLAQGLENHFRKKIRKPQG